MSHPNHPSKSCNCLKINRGNLKNLYILKNSRSQEKYRYSVTCGLSADIAGMIAAVLISYFFFG